MEDTGAKTAPEAGVAPTHTGLTEPVGPIQRPAGWMYKGRRIGRHELWYASPKVQLLIVAMVCFLCPGMFNALSGLGGAGLDVQDAAAQDNASVALYSTFAVVGFFSGTIANRIGIRLTMAFGGVGYCVYAASFLCYKHTKNTGFAIFAGALLGVCAGLLWAGQGAIMMSYPPEKSKGRYISTFWIIFNLGAVIGALIPLGENVSNANRGSVSDGTYAGLIVLMFVGLLLTFALCDAGKVQREDGSHVILMKNPSWVSEIKGLGDTFMSEPWIVLLFPMFFASNIFYTYQLNDFNGAHFNVRTRSLNNVLYWMSQIIGAVIFGNCLDISRFSRSLRAKISYIALGVLTFVIWGGGWAWQKNQPTREEVTAAALDKTGQTPPFPIDWSEGSTYIAPMFLFIFYGIFDAAWQTCIYWYMGALSNSGRRAANYAGFYKGIQSAGAAVFWRLDALHVSFDTVFGATWGLVAGSLIIAGPIIWLKIKDTVPIEEDLVNTDETFEEVAPAAALHHEKERTDVAV